MTGFWIALAIIAGILLLCIVLVILLLLFGRVRIRITSKGGLRAVASILGIPVRVFPEEDKLEKPARPVRCRNPKKALKRELRRQEKQQRAIEKARRKKERMQAKRRRKKTRQSKGVAKKLPAHPLVEMLSDLTGLIKKIYKVARKGLKFHIKKLHIYVATDDAAKTAVIYGVVTQSVSYLMHFIDTHLTNIRRDEGDLKVEADYHSQTPRADIDIVCSVRLYKILTSGVLNDADLIPKQKKAAPKPEDSEGVVKRTTTFTIEN